MILTLLTLWASAGELGFEPGASLHTTGMKRPGRCVECHDTIGAKWERSRHRVSWSNDLMRAAYAAEPLDLCVRCHLPLPEQSAEVFANRDFYRSLDPDSELLAGSINPLPEPRAQRGIHCGTCHVRDGEILATVLTGEATHDVRLEPVLATGDFCVSCHDFPAHHVVNGVEGFTDLAMQATGAEWRAWVAAGGEERCQDCHMPDGRHLFRGAHDQEWLRQSVRVERHRDGLAVSSIGVGHHLPTGDIFRHLTLEARVDGRWVVLDWIGRRLEVVETPLGDLAQAEVVDTALRPGIPRVSELPEGVEQWRLRFHYASDEEQERGLLSPEQLVVVLAESPAALP